MTTEHWMLLGLTVLVIAIWYCLEWRKSLPPGRALAPARSVVDFVRRTPASNPFHIFALTFCRLWRNRSLVMILLGLWLASWALNALVIEPLVHKPYLERMGYSEEDAKESRTDKRFRVVIPGEIGRWALDALPKVPHVSLGGGGMATSAIGILVFGVFACALIYLWAKPPAWLPESARRAIAWPALLTMAGFLSAAGFIGVGYASMVRGELWSGWTSHRWLMPLGGLMAPFFGAALVALLWHAVYQAGCGDKWNLRRATVAAIDMWLPVAWLVFVIYLPITIVPTLSRALATQGGPLSGIGYALLDATLHLFSLPGYLSIAFVFVPWVILERRYGFGSALGENFRMMGRHWRKLVAFLPGYLILAAPPYGLLSHIGDVPRPPLCPYDIAWLGLYLLQIILMLVVVVLYTELRKSEQPVAPQQDGPDEETDQKAVQPTDG